MPALETALRHGLRLLPLRLRYGAFRRVYGRFLGDIGCYESMVGQLRFEFGPNDWDYFFNVFQPGLTRFLGSVAKREDTIIDVGANVGYFTAIAATHVGVNGKVVAFEPDPRVYPRLENLAARNPNFTITPIETAIGRECGESSFQLSEHLGWSSLGIPVAGKPASQTILRRVSTLDESLRGEPTVNIIKIDVEGTEADVLAGAYKTLQRPELRWVIAEVTPRPAAEDTSTEILTQMHELGFAAWCIDQQTGRLRPAQLPIEQQCDIAFESNHGA